MDIHRIRRLPFGNAFDCFLSMKRTKSSEDYFLGGRSLNGWVAALSAQARNMSAGF